MRYRIVPRLSSAAAATIEINVGFPVRLRATFYCAVLETWAVFTQEPDTRWRENDADQ